MPIRIGSLNPIGMKTKLIGMGIGILLLIAGCIYLYQQGKNHGISLGNEEISEYKSKVTELNNKLLRKEIIVRERVIREYHTKQIVRTKIQYINRDIIKNIVPEQYKLSTGWVYAHNQSALGRELDPVLAANPNPSNISDRAALIGISGNYDKFNRTADRLEALQKYIREVGIPITDEQVPNNPK